MYRKPFPTTNSGSSIFPGLTTTLVASVLLIFISFLILLFGIQAFNTGPKIQGHVGPKGDTGFTGPPGLCNLSSSNETFSGISLNLNQSLNMTSISSSIHFYNGSITFDNVSQCISIQPKLCVSEIGNNMNTITMNSPVIFNDPVTLLDQLNFSPSVYLYYNSVWNTIEIVGASLNTSIVMPLHIGNSGYLTNTSSTMLLIHGHQVIDVNASIINLNGFVNILEAILSPVVFWSDISLASTHKIEFGNATTVNGSIPNIITEITTMIGLNNLTVNGYHYNIVFRSSSRVIIESFVQIIGNVSITGNINSDLNLDGKIIFNKGGAQIYQDSSCLYIVAPSVCLNVTSGFTFTGPVTFLSPIQGDVVINGSLSVIGAFNLFGSPSITNLTVTNTLTSINNFLQEIVLNGTYQSTPGSQTFINGFLTTSISSVSTFNGQVRFLSSNASSATCTQPIFGPTSGCTPFCTNHSSCTDTFNSLTVTNNHRVQGNIIQNNSLTPHPCCTSTGFFNYLYQQWSFITNSSFFDSAPGFYPLVFNTNDNTNYINGGAAIGFTGGSIWTVVSNALYRVSLSAELDGPNTSANTYFLIFCGGNQVFTSPPFSSILSTLPFTLPTFVNQTTITIQHNFYLTLNILSFCRFQIGYQGGNISIPLGNKITIGIKLENYNN